MIDQRIFKEKVTLVNVDNSWYAVGTDICELSEYTRANYLFKTYCNKDNYIKALVQDVDIKREKILVNSDGILEICNITHKTISDENRKILNSVIKELNRLNNTDERDLIKEEIEILKKENKELKEIDKEKTKKATELLDEKIKKLDRLKEENEGLKKDLEFSENCNKMLNGAIKMLNGTIKEQTKKIEHYEKKFKHQDEMLDLHRKRIREQADELARRDSSLIYSIKARFRIWKIR